MKFAYRFINVDAEIRKRMHDEGIPFSNPLHDDMMIELMNKIGDEGWELIASEPQMHKMIFKRIKAE